MVLTKKKLFNYSKSYESLIAELDGSEKSERVQVRDDAFAFFKSNGFPGKKNESWKDTNIDSIVNADYSHILFNDVNKVQKDILDQYLFKGCEGAQLVFIDGWYHQNLSVLPTGFNGKLFIQSVYHSKDRVDEKITGIISESFARRDNSFSALNTACFLDGIWMNIPEEVELEAPIHIVHLATNYEQPHVTHPRNIISVGKGSSVEIIESWVSLSDNIYLTNFISDIRIAENARLNHFKLQSESPNAYHISHSYVEQKENSHYKHIGFDRGGKVVRNSINSVLLGQGCETEIKGLYLGNKEQHINNHTLIDHVAPGSASNELFRGILNDKSTAVFDGKILVRPDAQKTNARQSSSCLLLTEDVRINAKPQLEIYADDVQCSHGSTVGQLDEDALFYLYSRGIGKEQARNILIYAFAEEIIQSVQNKVVQAQIEEALQRFLI